MSKLRKGVNHKNKRCNIHIYKYKKKEITNFKQNDFLACHSLKTTAIGGNKSVKF